MPRCLPCDSCFLLSFFAALTPPHHLNSEHLPIGGLQAEDIQRLQQEAYREQFIEEAKEGNPLTIERLHAIEARVKRKIQEATSPDEHDEQ